MLLSRKGATRWAFRRIVRVKCSRPPFIVGSSLRKPAANND